MTSASDFARILKMLSDNRRTGILEIQGEGFRAALPFSGGRIVRVDLEAGSGWPLGDVLRELRIVSHDQLHRAARQALKAGRLPEEILCQRGWVTQTVLKRYQERLNASSFFSLANASGFRAEFMPKASAEIPIHPWDAPMPVPFALKELGRRLQAIKQLPIPLPDPEARFEKVPEAVPYILGDADTELVTPAGQTITLNDTDKRIFFFCNGRIQFQTLPIVTGLPLEKIAVILHKLTALGAIRLNERPPKRDGVGLLGGGARAVTSLVAGLLVAGLMVLIGLQVMDWASNPAAFPPRFAAQGYLRDGDELALRALQDALYIYFLNDGLYPQKLDALSEGGYVRRSLLSRPPVRTQLRYEPVEQGLAYRLERRRDDGSTESRAQPVDRRLEKAKEKRGQKAPSSRGAPDPDVGEGASESQP